jgi:choline dehydrogenase-like flavoprotein
VLACGAVNSAALLLRSATRERPEGLANSSGLVGRRLMMHNIAVLLAFKPTIRPVNLDSFQKLFQFLDILRDEGDHYPIVNIQALGRSPLQNHMPAFASPVGRYLNTRALPFMLHNEDLPRAENRVAASGSEIHVDYSGNNRDALTRGIAKASALLRECGFRTIAETSFMGSVEKMGYASGTLVFGDDPRHAVLDRNCRAHEFDNLYAVDSSFFPSAGSLNIGLTIMANALRVADHLKARG